MFSFFWKINIISDAQSMQSADKSKILGWKSNIKTPNPLPSPKYTLMQKAFYTNRNTQQGHRCCLHQENPTDSPTFPVLRPGIEEDAAVGKYF